MSNAPTSAASKSTVATVNKKGPGRPAKVAKPELDFSSLTVETAEAPRVQRKGSDKPNPFAQHVGDSWASKTVLRKSKDGDVFIGAGRQVIVPTVNAGEAVNLIRRAAAKANLGVAVATEDMPGGKTRVRFAAKARKVSRKTQNGPVTVTQAAKVA